MTRPSDLTRRNLIEEAIGVFAEKGFEAGSVRAITQKAKANQAAINYHFGSKEGLYREVLKTSIDAFSEKTLLSLDNVDHLPREEAVRLFMRQQLQPLVRNRSIGRYIRIFAWESLAPSKVFTDYITSEQIPMMAIGERIVRRFADEGAAREEIMIKTFWLINQAFAFIRNFATLSRPPMNFACDQPFVERLVDLLAELTIGALGAGPRETTAAST